MLLEFECLKSSFHAWIAFQLGQLNQVICQVTTDLVESLIIYYPKSIKWMVPLGAMELLVVRIGSYPFIFK